MRRVAVLMGGISPEREVSLASGAAVVAALAAEGFDVLPITVGHDLARVLAALTPPPDVVFNALHGRFGEDGVIQGVLDWIGIPYTHSGVRASALAMDKVAAKAVFASAGLPVAKHVLVDAATLATTEPMARPFVIKPPNQGSSVGVAIVQVGDNRVPEIARNWAFGRFALVEEFIPGRELTVGVMDGKPLAVTEIRATEGFYDYEAKYSAGGSRHIIPAELPEAAYVQAMEIAARAHNALGCRGASRADLRYDDTAGGTGRMVLLEVNTQPGLTRTSLLPEQARHCGIAFGELCAWMIAHAACRDRAPWQE